MLHKLCMIGLVSIAISSGPTHADEASTPWSSHPNVKIRLIAGAERLADRSRSLGVELQLAPGWKTYWRMPGDAGIPPLFDWSGSENFENARVQYPLPVAMPDQGGIAIGYKDTVTFPVSFNVLDPAASTKVALSLSLGVCKDICIPVEAQLRLTMRRGTDDTNALVAVARRQVPTAASPADGPRAPKIVAAAANLSGASPKIEIRTSGTKDLFAEAEGDAFLPLARAVGPDRFEIDLTKTPDVKDLAGKTLRFTLSGPDGAREATWVVR